MSIDHESMLIVGAPYDTWMTILTQEEILEMCYNDDLQYSSVQYDSSIDGNIIGLAIKSAILAEIDLSELTASYMKHTNKLKDDYGINAKLYLVNNIS